MAGSGPVASAPTSSSAPASAPTTGSSHASGHPSPAAGKILAEKGIAPTAVSGTGVGGRITKEDAKKRTEFVKLKA
jgi:2-oxoglutarate dehydrogenase E2 component (dihydrolipoamide succinyltransferase)